MPCGPIEIVIGGVLKEVTILDSEITNGHLTSPEVTGGITADDPTLVKLASDLVPHLEDPFGAAKVLGRLENCAGAPLEPGWAVPTCIEMADAIAAAADPALILGKLRSLAGVPLAPGDQVVAKADWEAVRAEAQAYVDARSDPALILGNLRSLAGVPLTVGDQVVAKADWDAVRAEAQAYVDAKADPALILGNLTGCNGLPIAPGTSVPTCGEMVHAIGDATEPAKVAGVFKNNEGNPLSPGTTLLSEEQTEALIADRTAEIINSVLPGALDDALDDRNFIEAAASATAPAASAGTALSTDVIGGRGTVMGAPLGYVRAVIAGAGVYIPYYGG